jgi:transcriptional regulator of NAD metabolism
MLPNFMRQLEELIERIDENLADKTETDDNFDRDSYNNIILPMLNKLKSALELKNIEDIDNILDELNHQPLSSKVKGVLEKIANEVLVAEFDDAIKTVEKLINTKG